MQNQYSIFDSIALVAELSDLGIDSITENEVHTLAFLSCLLSIANKSPMSSWGYEFSATQAGYPFSSEIYESLKGLYSSGFINKHGEYFQANNILITYYETLMEHSQFAWRATPIKNAAASRVLFPGGIIRSAVASTSEVNTSIELLRTEQLITERLVNEIDDFNSSINNLLSSTKSDLLATASIWIRYQHSLSTDKLLNQTS